MKTLTSYIVYALVIAFLANSLLDMGTKTMASSSVAVKLDKLGV